jgi:hypothetical protein
MKSVLALAAAFVFLTSAPFAVAAIKPSAATLATPESEWSFDRSNKEFRIHFGEETQGEFPYDDEDLLNIYTVRNDRLYGSLKKWNKENLKTFDDYRIWSMVADIAGKDSIKKNIGAYGTYRVPEVPVYAFVTRVVGAKEPSWILAINANGSNFNSNTWQRDMAITLLHEYGHIVTMNKTQVDNGKRAASLCKKTVFVETRIAGCTTKKSYLNAFVREFWSQDELDTSVEASAKGSDSFYRANRASFVTKYAAANAIEDIAESFTDFVLRAKPTGTSKKEQKILFFYDYPELVKERDRIRAGIVGYLHL